MCSNCEAPSGEKLDGVFCYHVLSPQGEEQKRGQAMFDTMNPNSPYFLDYVEELTSYYPEEEEGYDSWEEEE